eukprot:3363934-Pyramimonas_sp.AAC.1
MFLWAVELTFPHPAKCGSNGDGSSVSGSREGRSDDSTVVTVKIPEPTCFGEERQAQTAGSHDSPRGV